MQDFSKQYRGAVFFGLSIEEAADGWGKRDAMLVLQRAAKQTYYDDVRCAEVDDALAYLRGFNTRAKPFEDFRAALDLEDPRWRHYAARNALVRIQLALSGR